MDVCPDKIPWATGPDYVNVRCDMRRLDDEPLQWRYGITLRGLWLASNGQWVRDGSHPSVQYWPTMEQARAWRERHMPGELGAWAEAIGIFQGGVNVTAAVHNEEV
jgi:hypothetical protein